METEGLRRSTRVRKPVKSYAAQQAEPEEDQIVKPTASNRKRKKKAPVDDDDAAEETETAKLSKKAKKKAKSADPLDDDFAAETTSKKPQKSSQFSRKRTTSNRSWHADAAERRIAVSKRNQPRQAPGQEETRLRSYVSEPPKSYHDALKRANTQRMFVLDRERGVEEDCHANHHDCPCEKVQIAGSTGNVYTVTISHKPSCTCPAGIFTKKSEEKLCKHALYVLHNVLKAPDDLKCQNAFLTSELKEIFANAPALPADIAEDESQDGNRKALSDDCPICFMEFEEGEDVVWCRAACGNNIHKTCFDQWANAKANVTCPFCRTEWEYDAPKTQKLNVASVDMTAAGKDGGYRNVRDQLEYD